MENYDKMRFVHCDMLNLFKSIKNNDDPIMVDRYKQFAANMHRAELIPNGIFGENESHIIHWMANLREGSSTSHESQKLIYGFVFSLQDIVFLKLLSNVKERSYINY